MKYTAILDTDLSKKMDTHMQGVLNTYVENHKKSIESIKKYIEEVAKQAQETIKSIMDRDQEIIILKAVIRDTENKLQEETTLSEKMKMDYAKLQENNALVNDTYAMLEQKYDSQLANANLIITKQKADTNALHKENEGFKEQIRNLQEINRQLTETGRVEFAAYEKKIYELQTSNAQLQTHNLHLTSAFEAKELRLEEKLTTLAQLNDENLSKLRADQEEKLATFKEQQQLAVSNAAKQAAEILELQSKLNDTEQKCVHLQALNQELSNELVSVKKSHEIEIKEHKNKINELSLTNEDAQAALQSNERHHQEQIEMLQSHLDEIKQQRVDDIKILHLKVANLESTLQQLNEMNDELTEENKNAAMELNAKIGSLTLQIQEQDELKAKLNALETELQHKNTLIATNGEEMAKLEREKNNTIAELKYKMNQIGNVFGQTVRSACIVTETNVASSVNKSKKVDIQATTTNVTTATQHLLEPATSVQLSENNPTLGKRNKKRRTVYDKSTFSDFEDDESEPDWLSTLNLQKKNKNSNCNRKTKRTICISSPSSDMSVSTFDKLKLSKT